LFEAVFGHVGDKHGGLGRDQKNCLSSGISSLLKSMLRTGLASLRTWHFSRMVTSLADSVARPDPLYDAVQGFFNRRQVVAQLGLDDLDVRDQSTLPTT
jgi:hypothetical protein